MKKFFVLLLVFVVSMAFVGVGCSHTHEYSADWSKDATSHWHAATCEHTDEKSELANHNTDGTNGACSVCGYTPDTTGGNTGTTPDDGGNTGTTPDDGGNTGTTPDDGGNTGTTPDDGGNTGTTPDDGGNTGTTPDDGGNTGSTPDDGGNTGTTPDEGGNTGTTPDDGGNTGTTPDDSGNTGTTPDDQQPSHEHTYSDRWSSDDTHHWHKATCGHAEEISGKAEHTFVDGECTTCGAEDVNAEQPGTGDVTEGGFGNAGVEMPGTNSGNVGNDHK